MLQIIRSNVEIQRQAVTDVPPGFWDEFLRRIDTDAPRLLDSIAVVYAEHFTKPELDAILAFYESEVGRRFVERQPTVLARATDLGRRWGERLGSAIAEELGRRQPGKP
jgi:hypothetical protein